MIVWINGPFGVGKTSVARQLVSECDEAVLFDPEHLGLLVRLTVPRDASVDFQTLPLWRETVLQYALSLDRHYPGPIVVPMSVWQPDFHDELLGGLLASGVDVKHVTLMASRAELLERIAKSDEGQDWRSSHVDDCLESLASERFAVHVSTDGKTVEEIAQAVIALVASR